MVWTISLNGLCVHIVGLLSKLTALYNVKDEIRMKSGISNAAMQDELG